MSDEPDEAMLWARKRAREYTNPVYWDAIKNGHADHDWGIPEMTKGYRAGQAASAERIKALEEEIAAMQEITGNLRVEMSDMLTRLHELHPEDFVWLKEADRD